MNIPVRQYWALLATYLRPQRAAVVALAALILGGIALQLLSPQIVRGFIDTARAGGSSEALVGAALLFMGAALLQQLLAVLAAYTGEAVGWTATNRLRDDLAAHCLGLDMGFHKKRTPGEMIERVDGDVTVLSRFFSSLTVTVIGNVVLLVGVLVLLFAADARVGLALAAFAGVALAALVAVRRFAASAWHAERETSARVYGFLGEALSATEDVRGNGAEPYVLGRFAGLLRGWRPVRAKAGDAGALMWTSTLVVFALGDALAFGLSAWLFSRGEISLGTAYAVFAYTTLLARPIEQIRTQMEVLQRADASIGRVAELFATRSRLTDGQGDPLPNGALRVEFRDVTFAYEEDEAPVLHDLSFRLEPGRVLGLLGRTGSGKTTVARLLLRLYDPDSGEVRLGGVNARDARLAELRSRVGMVTQEVQLFGASVRDNLTFFAPLPEERVWAALSEVGMDAWARGLPEGLATHLEPGSLSAGEAQLLALARLFLTDPGLVVLDEASSRLDPATEARLEAATSRLLRGRTAVIIAHRLATVARADDILVLDGGRLLEHGPREGLARDHRSRFAALLRTGIEEVLA